MEYLKDSSFKVFLIPFWFSFEFLLGGEYKTGNVQETFAEWHQLNAITGSNARLDMEVRDQGAGRESRKEWMWLERGGDTEKYGPRDVSIMRQ